MNRLLLSALLAPALMVCTHCENGSRLEERTTRLNVFRDVLPPELRQAFDSIMDRDDCAEVGLLLENARDQDGTLDLAIDSIAQAELIDTFSNEDIVYYFWYYFADAVENGSIGEP